jgi:hypothetical protein
MVIGACQTGPDKRGPKASRQRFTSPISSKVWGMPCRYNAM